MADSKATLTRITEAMQVDRHRLRMAWQRLDAKGQLNQAEHPEFQKWLKRLEESIQQRQKREQSVPQLNYDPELPIAAHREEIIGLLRERQTIVVCGETGSGKSTQLPKICLEAGLGSSGMIGHTQPRRLAARAVAARLADELGTRVGDLVGFKIRFADATQSHTLVKLMTDGVLLAETQSDRFLDQYEVLIIDEAHERSLNIDFLLGYLRRIQVKRPDLKLIITSATIDPQRFAEHFTDDLGPAPIVEVSGRTYPVEVRYQPPSGLAGDDDNDELAYLRSIGSAADELMAEGPGDTLVFLPTERDIRVTAKYLRGHFTRQGRGESIEILPLYARLSQAEQNKIFAEHPGRRIVLATNVAESSLTVPGIHYVIDTGLVRISRYAPRSKVQRLPIEDISQASANQRSGRCGRLGPGVCIRLYDEKDFQGRAKFTTPEIRRSDLANVMLQSHMLRLGPLEEFPLLDIPSPESIRDAQRTLRELGAVDAQQRLTAIGRQLGRLPCDPRVGRMLLEAHERNCLAEVIIIAAGLESQDVRQRPAGQRPEADAAHAKFQDPHSDFLSLIRLWDFYEKLKSDLGRSRLQKALNQNFLSFHGFREWAEIVRQLKDLLIGAGLKPGKRVLQLAPVPEPDQMKSVPDHHQRRGKQNKTSEIKLPRPQGYASIHQSLLAGLLSGIAERGDRNEYKAAGGLSISLWPGSGLFKRTPKWIVAAEIVETTKRFGRTVAELDVEWIEMAGQDLIKHSYSDPHWSQKAGAAMVYRKSILFGLTIVTGRRVPYAPIDRSAAQSMMIEHGLVGGEWKCTEAFYEHNREMIADIDELVRRTRSRQFIIDRFHLANFYTARLPEEVFDLNTLRGWINQHRGKPEEKSLWMQPEDLIPQDERLNDFEKAYPNTLSVGSTEFPLAYHFEPGHQGDGVTITVPQVALRQVSEEALGWLVPGLLEEKILAIIKAMPKSLRTNFVPAPDVARKLALELETVPRDQPFTSALSEAMSRHAGERITVNQVMATNLPEHLQFLVRVIDDEGQEVAVGRDVQSLVAQYSLADISSGVPAKVGGETEWVNRVIQPPQLDEVPSEVMIRRGGVLVAAFPALVDVGTSVEVRLADTQAEADRISRTGMTRLFAIQNAKSLRNQVKHLPRWNESAVALGSIMPTRELQNSIQDLVARVALVDGQSAVRSSVDFEARNARASVQISIATQEIADWLPKLATHFHELRLNLEQAPGLWQEVSESIRSQRTALFQTHFLRDTPWQWLKEYPRYLHAAKMRLDKLKNGGLPKDRKLSEPIEAALFDLRAAEQSPRCTDPIFVQHLSELRWTIEELRVSIFAQQLGTKQTVSPKRIREIISRLQ